MKKFSLFALAAAGMLLSACSSSDDVAEGKLNQYDMIEGQSSWIALGIALPSDPITRANEDLNDGDATEFQVNSAMLVLFKGATEDDATLIKEYEMTNYEFEDEDGDNVPGGNTEGTEPSGFGEVTSTSKKIVTEIESPSLGTEDNLYGYVILNYKNNATGLSYAPGTKFSEFKTQVLHAIGIADESKGFGAIGSNGLVMTNVPIADNPGGPEAPIAETKVTTLAKIDKNAIYNTKAAAEAGSTVACIYVERAAVKVEVKNNVTKVNLASGDLTFTFGNWALGNVNNNASGSGYYNTRQFDTEWLPYNNKKCATEYLKFRMVGQTNFFPTTAGHTKAYRTYFGRDVNYTGNVGLINAELDDAQYTLANNAVTYTYENTFDANSQIWANTTYVGIKGTIAGGDFYTIEGQPNTRLLKTDLANEVAKNASSTINTAMTNINAAIDADLAKAAGDGRTLPTTITKVKYDIEPVVTIAVDALDNEVRAADGSVTYSYTLQLKNVKDQNDDEITGEALTTVNTLAGANLTTVHDGTTKIYKFVGGVVYYSMRIAHFGDTETPWDAPNESYNQYDKVYPSDGKSLHATPIVFSDDPATRASAWLGRWGIVRNNWYRLTIDKIEGLGSPVPEDYSSEIGNTPDDNPKPKYYIAAHVHILPWTVRKQSVKF